jgi:hypothetical protein
MGFRNMRGTVNMGLTATPQHPLFAARISGIDLCRPVAPAQLHEIIQLMDRYAVCAVGHDQPPTNEEQIAFSALLGPMDRGRSPKIAGTGIRIPHNEIVDQSNLDQDGVIYGEGDRRLLFKRANRLWQAPSRGSMGWWPSIVTGIRANLAAAPIRPMRSGPRARLRAMIWCLPAPARGDNRSTSRRTSQALLVGGLTMPAPCWMS